MNNLIPRFPAALLTCPPGMVHTVDYIGVACPSVGFTDGYGPPEGASSFVACP